MNFISYINIHFFLYNMFDVKQFSKDIQQLNVNSSNGKAEVDVTSLLKSTNHKRRYMINRGISKKLRSSGD